MNLFHKLKEPIFLIEDELIKIQLDKMKELEPKLGEEGKILLQKDIRNLEYGRIGEKNIIYELKNSHMPMYVLHNVNLRDGDLSSQIDFLVFTRKVCFAIECKNLYGNIEIDQYGNFIRHQQFNGRWTSKGIYSPISQNKKHLDLIKKLRIDDRKNFLSKSISDFNFDSYYKPIVVLANPETILNAKAANKKARENVIRAGQLIEYIKDVYKQSKVSECSDMQMLKWARTFLELHQEEAKDYLEKYKQYRTADENVDSFINEIECKDETNYRDKTAFVPEEKNATSPLLNVQNIDEEETEIFKQLKSYRLNKSKEENIKAYYIYNNNQLKDLINKMPKTIEELQTVQGFGPVKANKYGEEIIEILNKYRL